MDINAVMTKSMELDYKIESLLKLSTFYDYDDLSGLHYDYEDDYHEVPFWTRVEHNGTDYYLVGYNGIKLKGLTVRVREVA